MNKLLILLTLLLVSCAGANRQSCYSYTGRDLEGCLLHERSFDSRGR